MIRTFLLTVLPLLAAGAGAAVAARADDTVSDQPWAGYFPLAGAGATADIFVGRDDWQVAHIAAGDLALDIERVTGRRRAPHRECGRLRPGFPHRCQGLRRHPHPQ